MANPNEVQFERYWRETISKEIMTYQYGRNKEFDRDDFLLMSDILKCIEYTND